MPIARVTRGHHAVEHVDAAQDGGDDVLRPADSHEIARLFGRHVRQQTFEHAQPIFFGFADRKSTYRETFPRQFLQRLERGEPQRQMHSALHDGKQLSGRSGAFLSRRIVVRVAARCPTHRAFHGIARLLFGRGIRRAVVERHGDVRAERELRVHRIFRRQAHRAAVDRRTELHALLGDLAQRLQTEDLEAARVCEYRPAPVHETVQTTMRAQYLVARTQHQMKSVAEHDLRAEPFELFRRHRLDRAIRAHGHEGRRLHRAVRELEPAAPRRSGGA